jgi:hypothetical protein
MASIETICTQFPGHGRIACRKCYSGQSDTEVVGRWQMVNDPGAWGSSNPKVLILGFSKGFTQASAYKFGRFEDVPFKDMRHRLIEELRVLGIIGPAETVDEKMVAGEKHLAFGSLVRCSLSRMSDKGTLECTSQVMPKAFTEDISANLRRCAETYLSKLPETLRLVLMLGTTDSYIEGCRNVVRSIHRAEFSDINPVSYRTGRVIWTHISHPSGLNGHHPKWMSGDITTKSGRKFHWAMDAIRQADIT